MSERTKEGIYVELDCLLDTRIGTIAKLSEDAAVATLQADYHKREIDDFAHVDMDTFKKLYAERDWETLAYSRPTALLVSLTRLSAVLAEQAIVRPYHDGAKIVVNTYPYQLTDAELDTIGKAVAAWMHGYAPVELTYMPPESLTPLHCKQSYAMMIVYQYEDWMNLHAEAFKTTRIPQILMLAPALYFAKKPTQEELEKMVKEAAHPMRAIELLASPIVQLRLLDVNYFSVLANA